MKLVHACFHNDWGLPNRTEHPHTHSFKKLYKSGQKNVHALIYLWVSLHAVLSQNHTEIWAFGLRYDSSGFEEFNPQNDLQQQQTYFGLHQQAGNKPWSLFFFFLSAVWRCLGKAWSVSSTDSIRHLIVGLNNSYSSSSDFDFQGSEGSRAADTLTGLWTETGFWMSHFNVSMSMF